MLNINLKFAITLWKRYAYKLQSQVEYSWTPPNARLDCLVGKGQRLCAKTQLQVDTVSNLGVFLDSSFKRDKQVSSVERSSFYQLSQISKAKPYIPRKDLEKRIHAFVTPRLDYCNA